MSSTREIRGRILIWEACPSVLVGALYAAYFVSNFPGAAHGRASRTETPSVLDILRQARALGRACFPISYAHYIETRKYRVPDRRSRLATFMLELSDGKTVAPPDVVVRSEIEVALGRYFPGRVAPDPFQFLGVGLAHAAGDMSLDVRPEWPPEANDMPTSLCTAIEGPMLAWIEYQLLSGVQEVEPWTDLTAERQFGASLDRWRGAALRYLPDELEREIYTSTLSDIDGALREALARYEISSDEFALLGESRCWALLAHMPSRRADMHLKRQWAKNADLPPRDSDLIDWAFLGVAVSYCDIVVTEKQAADLFSRGFDTRATVISQLSQLPELLE